MAYEKPLYATEDLLLFGKVEVIWIQNIDLN